jgi:hypothetical protein
VVAIVYPVTPSHSRLPDTNSETLPGPRLQRQGNDAGYVRLTFRRRIKVQQYLLTSHKASEFDPGGITEEGRLCTSHVQFIHNEASTERSHDTVT